MVAVNVFYGEQREYTYIMVVMHLWAHIYWSAFIGVTSKRFRESYTNKTPTYTHDINKERGYL